MPVFIILTIGLIIFLVGSFCLRTTFYRFRAGGKLRIVQLSDLHARRFGTGQARLLSRIRALKPDVIVITGDLLRKHHPQCTAPAMELVRGLIPLCSVYVVRGNHEAECDSAHFSEQLRSLGAYVLRDEAVLLRPGVELVGLDDRTEPGMPRPRRFAFPRETYTLCRTDCFSILAVHRPDFLDEYACMGAQLVLSGHAHGGLIRLPWRKGLYSPDEGFFPTYTYGLYEQEDCRMIVNCGLSRLRLFNRPEITVIDLD